jgi:hypothetical protein
MKKAKPDISKPSFVASRDGKTLPRAKGYKSLRCFWNVATTGDDGQDSKLGARLALEYLAYEEAHHDGGALQMIVADMPRRLTMIEIAFLQMVSFAAAAGAYRARQIAKYWDEMAAQKKRRRSKGRRSAGALLGARHKSKPQALTLSRRVISAAFLLRKHPLAN